MEGPSIAAHAAPAHSTPAHSTPAHSTDGPSPEPTPPGHRASESTGPEDPTGAVALLRRCLDGSSEEDWQRLIRVFGPWIRSRLVAGFRAWRLRPAADEVDDLVQDLFLHLLRREGEPFAGRDSGAVLAYFERSVRNLLVDLWRRRHTLKRGFEEVPSGLLDGRDLDPRRRPLVAQRVAHHLVDKGPDPEQETARRQGHRLFVRSCLASHRHAQERKSRELAERWVGAEIEVQALLGVFVDGSSSLDVSRDLGGVLQPRQVDALVARLRRHLERTGVRLPSRRNLAREEGGHPGGSDGRPARRSRHPRRGRLRPRSR